MWCRKRKNDGGQGRAIALACAAAMTLSSCFFGFLHDGGTGGGSPSPSTPAAKDYSGFRVTITGLASAKARAVKAASVRAPGRSVFPTGLVLVSSS